MAVARLSLDRLPRMLVPVLYPLKGLMNACVETPDTTIFILTVRRQMHGDGDSGSGSGSGTENRGFCNKATSAFSCKAMSLYHLSASTSSPWACSSYSYSSPPSSSSIHHHHHHHHHHHLAILITMPVVPRGIHPQQALSHTPSFDTSSPLYILHTPLFETPSSLYILHTPPFLFILFFTRILDPVLWRLLSRIPHEIYYFSYIGFLSRSLDGSFGGCPSRSPSRSLTGPLTKPLSRLLSRPHLSK